jgi:hypothetical protein
VSRWLAAAAVLAFLPWPCRADGPQVAQARRTDLAVLRDAYVRKSPAFAPAARADALAHRSSLEARAGALTDAEFLIGVARTAALADNGHDGWHAGDDAWLPKRRAPLRFAWFPDALVVARAADAQRDLPGAKVIAIDGHDVGEVYARLRLLSGGTEGYRRWNLAIFLERAELLHALDLADADDRYTLSLVLRDGTERDQVIEMVPRDQAPPGAEPGLMLAGLAPPAGRSTPLYLREPGRLFRFAELPEIGAVYLQFRSHYGTAAEPIERFLPTARATLAETRPEHLVVDLRFDTGGNIDPTVAFFRELPTLAPGRIYVIVSRMTFSAGIVAAALTVQAAKDRAVIVGEPVGDRLRFWSEGAPLCLPESKYCVQATDGLWDLVNGCAQEPGCYGDRFGVKVPDLDPDLAAPLTASAWLAGEDPAMTAIETHLWSCKSCRAEPDDGG